MRRFEDVKDYKIKTVIGLAFILFGIVLLINIGYVSQSLVMAFTFIFGFFAYWFIFPAFIVFGLYLIITRKKNVQFKLNPILIGLALFTFGLLILITIIPYPGVGTDTNPALHITNFNKLFFDNWTKAIAKHPLTNYYRFNPLYYQLGSGWFGHLFAGLLSVVTKGGSIAICSLLLLIALILMFSQRFKLLVNKIKANRLARKLSKEEKAQTIDDDLMNSLDNDIKASKEEVTPPIENNDELNDDSEALAKHANLFSNDDTPVVGNVSESTIEGGELHAANIFNDDEVVTKDMQKLDKEVKKELPPYVLPSYDLLRTYENGDIIAKNEEHCKHNEEIINKTFQLLKVGAKVVGHTIGPRVTRYDIQVDADASIQAIPRYITDLSQRLGGVNARFEAIVTGKVTSGLEVANKESAIIGFKEIISVLPKGDKYSLVIPFGKNISGEIKYADLSKFPHLLIGGATGSGKSVFVHSLIMTLIMRNTPSDVRLLLIDPKRVEFTHYKNSPFLLCPVVSDPRKAKVALEKLVEEMERRYTLFESSMTNNILSYNAKMKASHKDKLPYIVTIVDEFADLIQQNKKIDLDIARITAKARAAGIHLVIATQRPSVDVITGVIKSNLPVRVALSVPDIESSKTIIGGMGAEQLLGNGDMLVSCPQIQAAGCVRAQACFVTDEEIDNVVNYINSQREPSYEPRFMDLEDYNVEPVKSDEVKMSPAEARKLQDDELYNLVKEQVYKREYTSISVIERENSIGFTRAGRLFKRLQDEGLVSLENEASKGSRVLKENFKISENKPKIGSEELTDTKENI